MNRPPRYRLYSAQAWHRFMPPPGSVSRRKPYAEISRGMTKIPLDTGLPLASAVLELSPMNQVHLIGGEKGGVGKSVVARALAQYCIDHDIPLQGFDSDRSHGSFQRFYEDYTRHVVLEDFESLDQLAETSLRGDGVQVVVDLAAQSSKSLRKWMEDTGVFELFRDAGVKVNCWHVLDDGRDSLDMLGRLLDEFKEEVNYVIALNHGRGAKFGAFHDSPFKARALELGAKIIEIPKLHESSMRQVDHTNSSFWAATNAAADGSQLLGILERQRVKVWLRKLYSELDQLGLR
ncbi:MAG: hypothetical protein QM680_03315 [Luteolibacter sp.]